MIHNNLSVLMAERNIKAARVSAETGISRSTLNSISNNASKMIQMETINTLCSYLKTSPQHFFSFSPIDFNFNFQFPLDEQANHDSDGFGGEHWWVNINKLKGDLFVNSLKNYQKESTFELTFESSHIHFEGVGDHYDSPLTMKVQINDTDGYLKEYWNNNNLYEYHTIFSNQLRDAFISALSKQDDISNTLDMYGLTIANNINLNIDIPVEPF